jgi:type II secretory ATPase GspE/PulE/Tfp pilus assembly ATPase PilB-like protein
MRPDRIVVGEVRGEEAFDMLQAMNTGHEGSLTTVHANSVRDALARIENMVSMANLNIPERAVRHQIASAFTPSSKSPACPTARARSSRFPRSPAWMTNPSACRIFSCSNAAPSTKPEKCAEHFTLPASVPSFADRLATFGQNCANPSRFI